jgi:hypothetical protein
VTNRPLHGVVPALVTPFKENERIDYGAWQDMIDVLIDAGVHGLFVAGSQGEFYALDMEERTVSMRFCKQAIAGRVPFYANVGCITTRDTIAGAGSTGAGCRCHHRGDALLHHARCRTGGHYVVCRRAAAGGCNFRRRRRQIRPAPSADRRAVPNRSVSKVQAAAWSSIAYKTPCPTVISKSFAGGGHLLLKAWSWLRRHRHHASASTALRRLHSSIWLQKPSLQQNFRLTGSANPRQRARRRIWPTPSHPVIKEAMDMASLPGGPLARSAGACPRRAPGSARASWNI